MRRDSFHLHSLHGLFDYMVMRLDLFSHVVVLLAYFNRRYTFPVFPVDEFRTFAEHFLLLPEQVHVVIAYYIGECGFLHGPVESCYMQEPFVAFRIFRPLVYRQHCVQFHSDQYGIQHFPFGVSRMDVASLDMDCRRRRVEILVFQFSYGASVHCVSVSCPEFPYIELCRPSAYLFIGSERDLYLPVSEFWVLRHILDGIHYLRHSGLVIRSEQSRAIRRDYRLPLVLQQFREFVHLEAQPVVQPDVLPVIVRYYLRMDVFPGSIGRCVHMGDEPYRRHIFPAIRRNRCHHVSVFIQFRRDAHGIQFVPQDFQQVQLPCRARLAFGILVRLRVHSHISQKSVKYLFHSLSIVNH